MRILIAPNAFKETLSAAEAAQAIARGLRAALPRAALQLLPVADGGDGTAAVLRRARGGSLHRHRVTGPLGRPVWAIRTRLRGPGPPTEVLEMAQTSGLALVPPDRRDPLRATTRGLGELIAIARRGGARRLLIGLGGSATVDGGAGMAAALGFGLLDRSGRPLADGGGSLARLARIIPSAHWNPVGRAGVHVIALADVKSPLLGAGGTATVFGPQKGATPKMVRRLNAGLRRLARRMELDLGRRVAELPGAGAAGGLAAGLAAFLGAEIRPGGAFVLEMLDFDAAAARADWVLTGEGRLDAQTLAEKAPLVVARRAAELGVPTIALAGAVAPEFLDARRAAVHPFYACFSAAAGAPSRPPGPAEAARALTRMAFQIGRLLGASGPGRRRGTRRRGGISPLPRVGGAG